MTHYLKRAIVFFGQSERVARVAIWSTAWLAAAISFACVVRIDPLSSFTVFCAQGLLGMATFVPLGIAVVFCLHLLFNRAPAALHRYAKYLEGNWKDLG